MARRNQRPWRGSAPPVGWVNEISAVRGSLGPGICGICSVRPITPPSTFWQRSSLEVAGSALKVKAVGEPTGAGRVSV